MAKKKKRKKKTKVLIIDSNPRHLAYVKTCVQIHQAEPLVAMDWCNGFDTAKKEKPDAIFIDDSLPNAPQEEIVKKLKNDPDTTRIPVTFLTSKRTPPKKGPDGKEGPRYLSKKLDPRTFINRMPEFLPGD